MLFPANEVFADSHGTVDSRSAFARSQLGDLGADVLLDVLLVALLKCPGATIISDRERIENDAVRSRRGHRKFRRFAKLSQPS